MDDGVLVQEAQALGDVEAVLGDFSNRVEIAVVEFDISSPLQDSIPKGTSVASDVESNLVGILLVEEVANDVVVEGQRLQKMNLLFEVLDFVRIHLSDVELLHRALPTVDVAGEDCGVAASSARKLLVHRDVAKIDAFLPRSSGRGSRGSRGCGCVGFLKLQQ